VDPVDHAVLVLTSSCCHAFVCRYSHYYLTVIIIITVITVIIIITVITVIILGMIMAVVSRIIVTGFVEPAGIWICLLSSMPLFFLFFLFLLFLLFLLFPSIRLSI